MAASALAIAELLSLSITALQQVTSWQQNMLQMHSEGRTDLTDAEVAAFRGQALQMISLLATKGST